MKIVIAHSYEQMSRVAADFVGRMVRSRPECVLGLATGSTPLGLYAELVRRHERGAVDFSQITTFNLDEYRNIPIDHEQSYRRYMQRNLFGPLGLDTARTHLPDCANPDGDAACDAYERAIERAGGIDLHFHGCIGQDVCDGSERAIAAIARYQAARGVTAICPATMTYPEERLATIMDAVWRYEPAEDEAALVGINLEGPFISPCKVGAQNPASVQACDAAMLRRLQARSGGLVKLVDVAPEEPGALEFIGEVAGEVRVSLAHTCADYECARAAFDAGASQLTHLFNAMPGLHHRKPGPIAAAAERSGVAVELIADGVHVHPAMVRLAFKLFGAERVILVSDSMRACGAGDGAFDLGGQDVRVNGNVATLADGTIAGSVTDLAECVRIAACDMGVPLESALLAATVNPARALGLAERGSIAPGNVADLVLLDPALNVARVILRGTDIQ